MMWYRVAHMLEHECRNDPLAGKKENFSNPWYAVSTNPFEVSGL